MQKMQYGIKLLRTAALCALSSAALLNACASSMSRSEVEQMETVNPDVQVNMYTAGKVSLGQNLPFGIVGDDVSARFTGKVFFKALITRDPQYQFQQTNLITFAPGARSAWHNHGPMYLLGIGGIGYYQEAGKKAVQIKSGDVIFCPPDVRHWHGAAPDSWFAQIVIYDSAYLPVRSWPQPVAVSSSEYQQATATDAAKSVQQESI